MTLDEIKSKVLEMSVADQVKFITDVVPLLWTKACGYDSCVAKMRELVDEATIKNYREQHMGNV